MLTLIKLDLKNCIKNEKFKIYFLSLLGICIFSFLAVCTDSFMSNSLQLNFPNKMGIMLGNNVRSVLQFILLTLPLIACGIYSDSFIYERDNNICVYYLARINKRKYFTAKMFSIFIIVFFTILLPLSINELLTLLAIPNVGVDHGYGLTVYLLKANASEFFLQSIYNGHPYLYNYLLILITSFYGALVAVIGFNISLLFQMKKINLLIYMFLGVNLTSFVLPQKFQIYNYIQSNPGNLSDFIIALTGWIVVCIISGTIGIWKETRS
ncbi:hypothetical protein [Clostridium estertheticum]|uniref:hypothetical protein n=2 Tax=Clostridium estertheticum TaxID=238834 RepID=UPI001CF2D5A3|nr:hypothetical protein [Clostridium estertheticum]MCB2339689.1 hypothetical protein [Clostridium estertheticum]